MGYTETYKKQMNECLKLSGKEPYSDEEYQFKEKFGCFPSSMKEIVFEDSMTLLERTSDCDVNTPIRKSLLEESEEDKKVMEEILKWQSKDKEQKKS